MIEDDCPACRQLEAKVAAVEREVADVVRQVLRSRRDPPTTMQKMLLTTAKDRLAANRVNLDAHQAQAHP
jgi:hypothetical protein